MATWVSVASINAIYQRLGQLGAAYTAPAQRGRGLSRMVMRTLLHDCLHLHHLQKVTLFTGPSNAAARALYDSLGFSPVGEVALFFGKPREPMIEQVAAAYKPTEAPR